MKEADLIWDAGTMGCGELLIELRFKMAALESGQTIKLIARDPGAPEDLPAWCRLTGHSLTKQTHPEYWIKKG